MIQSDQRLNHSVYVAKYNSHDSLVTETDSAIINMTVVPKIYLPNQMGGIQIMSGTGWTQGCKARIGFPYPHTRRKRRLKLDGFSE